MDTLELTLSVPALDHDRMIAWLEDRATGFVQEESELRAYVPAYRWSEEDQKWLEERLVAAGYADALAVRPLASRNWNAAWEESIPPVRAGSFLLCPTSGTIPSKHADATVLRIDPAMSFGTGHHATTRLALQLLDDALAPGDRVLDVGTGTGVLAIAACRQGAMEAVGVDTNPDAVANARQNAAHNEVADCVTVFEGSVGAVSGTDFDVVAANITLRVLLDLLPDLRSLLTAEGHLILSGVLSGDRDRVLDALPTHDLSLQKEKTEDGWWGASCCRSS